MAQNSDVLKMSFKFEAYFLLCNSMSSIQPSRKQKKNCAEILDCGHPTYTVNNFKFGYPGSAHVKGRSYFKFGNLAVRPLI